MKSFYSHILYEVRKVKYGFINLKRDVQFYFGVKKEKIQTKYQMDDYTERVKTRQVRQDVIKFIPFSFLILIPGAEILLPPYLLIFPNSIPSQFLSEEARDKKFKEVSRKRKDAAKRLNVILPNYLYSLEKDD